MKTKKNYGYSFKGNAEFDSLITKTLDKLRAECNIEITQANFLRTAVSRICNELLHGTIKSTELLYKNKR